MTARRRVLVGGAGVGGLEAAFALEALAAERVDVTVIAPERHFVYRPLAAGEPFGPGATVQLELARVARERGFGIVRAAIDCVDGDRHVVRTQEGELLGYDSLVLALGARARAGIPGALTFRGPRDIPRVGAALESLAARPAPRIVFALSPGTIWTLPIYELALLATSWARARGVGAEIAIVTPESAPMEAFGAEVAQEIAGLLEAAGIRVLAGSVAESVRDGALHIPTKDSVPADLIVSLPLLTGPDIAGLPKDPFGFVPIDELCRVEGLADVFAVGDMAARDLVHGGLASQQADVAAHAIAAAAGVPVTVEPYEPALRALLFIGGEPRSLRAPQLPAASCAPHKVVGLHLSPYMAEQAAQLAAGRSAAT